MGQTFRVAGIPVAKGLRGGYADVWQGYDAVGFGQVGHGVDFFASAEAENGSPDEEERDVGAYFGCYFEAFCTGKLLIQLVL